MIDPLSKQMQWKNLIYLLNALIGLDEDNASQRLLFFLYLIYWEINSLVEFPSASLSNLEFERTPFTFRLGAD